MAPTLKICLDGPWLKDEHGRTLLLRGVNLGGSSKVPFTPNGATHLSDGFFNHRDVSFIGRPFPLADADEHFRRLKSWGMTTLRLLVTWEAVEHAGPGIYDLAYLDYLRELVCIAAQHGLHLIIDPHQDVWSRFSGGDGAPGWTFELIGMDLTQFDQTGAAVTHQLHDDPFPRMIWPTNSGKLAAATMFTLFFGSRDFAPGLLIEHEPVQEYLQRHYIASMVEVARALKGLPNVVGFDTMNEPLPGYIGCANLSEPMGMLKIGPCPSPAQSMYLGEGFAQTVGVWRLDLLGNRVVSHRVLNPEGNRCWLPAHDCIWHKEGVWEVDDSGEPGLARPDHFTHTQGVAVDFNNDYYRPFARQYAREIRKVMPDAILFLEGDPRHGEIQWSAQDGGSVVFAPHWYDGIVLVLKDFNAHIGVNFHTNKLVIGKRRIRRSFAAQLDQYRWMAANNMGGVPTMIGEVGVAFDLKGGRAYRTGNFHLQEAAYERSFRAVEDNLLGCLLWNYTADNDNQHGDQWNGEDLSIFSRDQQSDTSVINSGGRALQAVVRPYPIATAGEPLELTFSSQNREFIFRFRHDPAINAPTEVFLPAIHYQYQPFVTLSDGRYTLNPDTQTLSYFHDPAYSEHTIWIRP